jgi:hypothetical protein
LIANDVAQIATCRRIHVATLLIETLRLNGLLIEHLAYLVCLHTSDA